MNSLMTLGRATFDLSTKTFSSPKLQSEFDQTVSAMLTAKKSMSTAAHTLALSLARIERDNLYSPDFDSVNSYAKYAFGLDDKAASTISGYIKAGREYLAQQYHIDRIKQDLDTASDDETRQKLTDKLAREEEVNQKLTALSPAQIAEIRTTSARSAIRDGEITGTETLRELREYNTQKANKTPKTHKYTISIFSFEYEKIDENVTIPKVETVATESAAKKPLDDFLLSHGWTKDQLALLINMTPFCSDEQSPIAKLLADTDITTNSTSKIYFYFQNFFSFSPDKVVVITEVKTTKKTKTKKTKSNDVSARAHLIAMALTAYDHWVQIGRPASDINAITTVITNYFNANFIHGCPQDVLESAYALTQTHPDKISDTLITTIKEEMTIRKTAKKPKK